LTYVVRPGDNLWSISQRFGVTPQAIMQANNITNPNYLYVGQTIIIPSPGPLPGPTPPPPGGGNLERRVDRLERKVERLERNYERLDRRVTRLERGRTREIDEY